ncbi:MAG: hypothetical protein KDE63_03960 [Novosphingobium sp.]|nr:hypothetical protein [Novosphingobium sp.]
MAAEQLAFVPAGVPLPLQLQFHGPVPDTADAVPVEQRLEVGALETVVPLAEPQTPLTVVTFKAVHVAVEPVGAPPPAHCQRHAAVVLP